MTDPETGGGAAPAARASRGRDVLTHQALVYRTGEELTKVAVGWLRAGLMVGDATVVIASPAVADLVRGQLGAESAAPIEFHDSAAWFTGPVQTMSAYHERAREHWWPHGRLRVLAEPVWEGRGELEVREWLRHEALLNEIMAGTPSAFLCLYDAALPAGIVEGALRTHPELLDEGGLRASPRFTDPADFYAECNAVPLDPPPLTAARRAFASGELPGLRTFLEAEARRLDLAPERVLPFVLAVNEVATLIIREGGGHGAVWVWSEEGDLVCDVTDPSGHLADRFLGHLPPRAHQQVEAAMWAVRRLCHIVEIRTGKGSGGGIGFRGVDAGTRIRTRLKLR
ncbi:anti-sigma factor RsbA family regulatory protein [Actinomadura kijaniata]|uniref:MEDS domain-containing protein n=1 Tax=Actinomadura namibiensis TaxID=182080 RepID=A0A7W3LNB9_ACTNM|nr:sensor histidine kinase [Actinomadura namibiensis]MBA8951291.1 hypothetical protein [Actinomadura namibiensis]